MGGVVGLVCFFAALWISIDPSKGHTKGVPLHLRDRLGKVPIMSLLEQKCNFLEKMPLFVDLGDFLETKFP